MERWPVDLDTNEGFENFQLRGNGRFLEIFNSNVCNFNAYNFILISILTNIYKILRRIDIFNQYFCFSAVINSLYYKKRMSTWRVNKDCG